MNVTDLETLADSAHSDLIDAGNLLAQSSNLGGDHLQQALEEVDSLIHAAETQLRRGLVDIDSGLDFDLVDGTYEQQIEWLHTVLEKLDDLIGELPDAS